LKFIVYLLSCVFLLNGCSTSSSELDTAMDLREKMLTGSCSFIADITADYADALYCFRMDCSMDSAGTMTFSVIEPASIEGITGTISADSGKLTFDDAVLAFPILADDRLTPVAAPWIFVKTLRSGYLSGCGKEGEGLRIFVDDSYAENALQLEITMDAEAVPTQADIFWNQQRILSLQIDNFVIL